MEPPQRRASDYYVPISLIVTSVATISAIVTIMTPIFGSLNLIENRITKVETRLERLDLLESRLGEIDKECSRTLLTTEAKK